MRKARVIEANTRISLLALDRRYLKIYFITNRARIQLTATTSNKAEIKKHMLNYKLISIKGTPYHSEKKDFWKHTCLCT